ncbi:MAG: N-acetylmuramoyl-L-alanine amidase [Clostridia bacterium]|nr:N-acetylmuramoyl-L-alanine amidase [Clostridia bacterium]
MKRFHIKFFSIIIILISTLSSGLCIVLNNDSGSTVDVCNPFLSTTAAESAQTEGFVHTVGRLTVVIDVGHGGIDGGVKGKSGVKESDINLAIALILERHFVEGGFNTVLTRRDENGLYGLATKGFKLRDMNARIDIIKDANPCVVLSIHQNAHSATYRSGSQVFFQKNIASGEKLASYIQKSLNKRLGFENRYLSGDYFILKKGIPASVIVECGFLSNAADEVRLQTEEYQNRICTAIYRGTLDYLLNK